MAQRIRFRSSCLSLLLLLVALPALAQAPQAPTGITVMAKPATPTIAALSPTSGAVGQVVTITGSGFSTLQGASTVRFNGTPATVSSWSALSLTTTVPVGATTGSVVVTVGGVASAGVTFTVTGGGGGGGGVGSGANIWAAQGVAGSCADSPTLIAYNPATACSSIELASTAADAGDIVRVRPGAYPEVPTPLANGTLASPITYVADGAVSVCGFDFTNASYLRIIGFNIGGTLCGARSRLVRLFGVSTGLEFWHNTFSAPQADGIVTCCDFANLSDRIDNSLIIGNRFTNLNLSQIGVQGGSAVLNLSQIGVQGGSAVSLAAHHLVVGYNEFDQIYCDSVGFNGTHHRWIGNYSHNMVDDSNCHSDFWQFGNHPLGLSQILLEANFQVGTGGGDEHTTIIQNNNPSRCLGDVIAGCGPVNEILARRNVVHDIGSGSWSMAVATPGGQMRNFRMLHNANVNVQTVQTPSNGPGCCAFYHAIDVNYVWIRHNVEYEAWSPSMGATAREVYMVSEVVNRDVDYNLAYDPTEAASFQSVWNAQAHKLSDINPLFTNYLTDDFTLQAASPAKDFGAALCTVASASGTGTTFTVSTGCGGWFRGDDPALSQYGGALVSGDPMLVGTDAVTVVSVAGDVITVTPAITWASGDPVFYDHDATPDLGPYPVKTTYTLTATQAGATTRTITPNDASLVRMVVCYDSLVPYAVDDVAPYSCPAPVGPFEARVYPRYPSKTRWVVATP